MQAERTRASIKFEEAFSSFSIDNTAAAQEFYGDTLGLDITGETEGLSIKFPSGLTVFLYPKNDHEPATFTVLNLTVANIDAAVDELTARGIKFESYGGDIATDAKGVFRGAERGHGPNIAWFKDPAGNILSLVERA